MNRKCQHWVRMLPEIPVTTVLSSLQRKKEKEHLMISLSYKIVKREVYIITPGKIILYNQNKYLWIFCMPECIFRKLCKSNAKTNRCVRLVIDMLYSRDWCVILGLLWLMCYIQFFVIDVLYLGLRMVDVLYIRLLVIDVIYLRLRVMCYIRSLVIDVLYLRVLMIDVLYLRVLLID